MFKSFIPDRASIVRNIISHGIAHLFWAGLGIFVWFAPQKWIAFLIEGLPEFFTPYRARVLFIGVAVIVFLVTLRPRPQQKHQSTSWLFRWPRKSKFTDIQESTPLNTIPLVELLKKAETQNWQFTVNESQHIFHFTSALRDAGSTGEIQFWGREVQHIQDHTRDKALTEIGSDMWKGALIRPLSCLENSSDGTTRIVSDNFRTTVEREALQGDLRKDIHLNRKQALSWLQHQVPTSLEEQPEEPEIIDADEGPLRMSLTEFGKISTGQGWDIHDLETSHIYDFVNGLQQAGVDETVEIWGRKKSQGLFPRNYPLVKIPADYWHRNKIDPHGCLHIGGDNDENAQDNLNITITTTGRNPQYEDIHVNRQQALNWLKREAAQYRGKTRERLDEKIEPTDEQLYNELVEIDGLEDKIEAIQGDQLLSVVDKDKAVRETQEEIDERKRQAGGFYNSGDDN